ncbi:MAG: transglutaminase domain-containing protein [Oscillospiraceae bacterium]|nr:transglutaminase domain-containing protein [Oscillospiraceae bacterium]
MDYATLLIDNLQRYSNRYAKAAELLSNPETVISGIRFSDAVMESLHDPQHPQFHDHWRTLLWEICCDAPFLFHITETPFQVGMQMHRNADGKTVPVCFPMPEITIEKYREMLGDFLPRWLKLSAAVKQKTAGCNTLSAALITALEISRLCSYDYTYSRNSIRNVLTDGSALCWGFTGCFNALMRQLGYRAEPVFTWDLGGEEHAWSAVWAAEQQRWCEIDVTWMNNTKDNHRFIDLCFFDCASGDREGFPQHYAAAPESVLLMTEPKMIDLSYSGGIGYRYLDHSRVVTEIQTVLKNQFRLLFSDGKEEILNL